MTGALARGVSGVNTVIPANKRALLVRALFYVGAKPYPLPSGLHDTLESDTGSDNRYVRARALFDHDPVDF